MIFLILLYGQFERRDEIFFIFGFSIFLTGFLRSIFNPSLLLYVYISFVFGILFLLYRGSNECPF